MSPTRAPFFWRARARLTAVVDFPTPPLPAPTAMMLRMPGTAWRPKPPRARTSAVMVALAAVTPGRARTSASASVFIWSFTGQAGVVSSMVKSTSPPAILTSFTKPRDTMSLWRSGSRTPESAPRTSSFVMVNVSSFGAGPRVSRSAPRGQRRVDRLLEPIELVGGAPQDGQADQPLGIDHERGRKPLVPAEGLRHVVGAQELAVGDPMLAHEVLYLAGLAGVEHDSHHLHRLPAVGL